MRPGRFKKKQVVAASVPTASMADIAFLLLIFFMATTIFKMENGLEVTLPRAQTTQRQQRERIMHVWIDQRGRVSVNDRLMTTDEIEGVVAAALRARPELVVAFNADDRAPYRAVSSVLDALKHANAVRVSFTSERKAPGEKRRREQ